MSDVTKTPPFTLTYHIRPEARWSDGTPVSARDFVFTHETSLSTGGRATPGLRAGAGPGRQRSPARCPDREGGAPLALRRLAPAVPVRAPGACARRRGLRHTVWNERIRRPEDGRSIGSGPFLVGRWVRGREITFERNPRYWRAGRRISTGSCSGSGRARGDDRVAAAERAGPRPRPRALGRARLGSCGSCRGRGADRSGGAQWEHLALRVQAPGHPALRNKLVRRAIAHAIDKAALVRALFGEADRRDAVSDSAFFATTSRYYRPNWSGLGYNPAESPRLLRQAGCRLGADGIYVCAGERLSLRAFTMTGSRSARRACGSFRSSCGTWASSSSCALSPAARCSRRSYRAVTSTSRTSRGDASPRRPTARSFAAAAARTGPATASGSSPATSTRRGAFSTPSSACVCCTDSTRGLRSTCR